MTYDLTWIKTYMVSPNCVVFYTHVGKKGRGALVWVILGFLGLPSLLYYGMKNLVLFKDLTHSGTIQRLQGAEWYPNRKK